MKLYMIIDSLKDTLNFLFKDKRMSVILVFFLIFYGSTASPKLPDFIVKLFNNSIFRIFVLSLIVYKGNNNPSLSLLIAFSFVIIMDCINKRKFTEEMKDIFKENFAESDFKMPIEFEDDKKYELWNKQEVITREDGSLERVYAYEDSIKEDSTITACPNAPIPFWKDSCKRGSPGCQETEKSIKLREAGLDLPAEYQRITFDKFFRRRVSDWSTDRGSGDCVYQYEPRQYEPKQCGNINKNPGLAMCQNTEDTIPDMDKVEYCSNLDGEKCEYKIKGQKNLVTSKDQIIQNE